MYNNFRSSYDVLIKHFMKFPPTKITHYMVDQSSLSRFCVSRKGRTGGGGWVNPKGANSMAMSGLACRKALVGTGRAVSVLFGINGLGNKLSYVRTL